MAENKKTYGELAVILDSDVSAVVLQEGIDGFQKAYLVAESVGKLKAALTGEYMKPIMDMQNTKLGFLTDKKDSGYPLETVKACLIEAVLTGVQPYGNQFNIIAGNMYVTKEGFGELLGKIKGLDYETIPALPRIDTAKGSGAVSMKIKWRRNGGAWEERDIDFAIKVNQYMGTDAVIGKATRKARAWLFAKVTGVEVGEGDVQDTTYVEIKDPGITYEDLMELYELKKEKLLTAERTNARRILSLDSTDTRKEGEPEVNSFKKLREQLSAL